MKSLPQKPFQELLSERFHLTINLLEETDENSKKK